MPRLVPWNGRLIVMPRQALGVEPTKTRGIPVLEAQTLIWFQYVQQPTIDFKTPNLERI
jgi:hypothetical protein